jgi:osmotically-inducible protein OsmY
MLQKTKVKFMHPKISYSWSRTLRPAFLHHLFLTLALLAGILQSRGADIVVAANNGAANGTVSGPSSFSEQPRVAASSEKSIAAADHEIMRTLAKELLDAPDASIVKKIKFQVSKGKVTLSGVAKNEKQKKEVIAMAARAAGAANVEDKIQLRK